MHKLEKDAPAVVWHHARAVLDLHKDTLKHSTDSNTTELHQEVFDFEPSGRKASDIYAVLA